MSKLNQKAAAPKSTATKGAPAKPAKTAAAPKVAAVRPDVIKEVKSAVGGEHIVVTAGAGNAETIRTGAFKGQLTKLAVVGGSLKAVREFIKQHKPEAKLATGLNGRIAPQSAQAAADSRAVGKGTASSASASPAKAASSKASAAAKLPKKSGYADNAPIKATDKGSTKGAKLPASDKLNRMIKAGTVAKALALDGMSSGDIRYAEKTGLITVG